MMVSLVEQGEEKISYDHERNSKVLCICQQFDDSFEMINSALLEVAAISVQRMIPTATEEPPMLKEFLSELASDSAC